MAKIDTVAARGKILRNLRRLKAVNTAHAHSAASTNIGAASLLLTFLKDFDAKNGRVMRNVR